jgi:hypothetical protein
MSTMIVQNFTWDVIMAHLNGRIESRYQMLRHRLECTKNVNFVAYTDTIDFLDLPTVLIDIKVKQTFSSQKPTQRIGSVFVL